MDDYGFGALVRLAVVGVCLMPLAIWKIIEIVWWLATHVRVTW